MKDLIMAAALAALLSGGGNVAQEASSRLVRPAVFGITTSTPAPVQFGWAGPSAGRVTFGW
ncbi:MAG: hypothetical protein AB7G62_04750 [Magnetospirillum sp.]